MSSTTAQKSMQDTKVDPISKSKKDLSSGLEVKAQAMVERLFRAKENLKDVKDTLKAYKITSEKLEELKKARKAFTDQVNDEKTRIEAQFQKDKTYNELREKALDCEEKIALSKQDLRQLLKDEALEKGFVELTVEVEGQIMKLQSQAKVAIYFNGKEEK